jgi:hypothetical protein
MKRRSCSSRLSTGTTIQSRNKCGRKSNNIIQGSFNLRHVFNLQGVSHAYVGQIVTSSSNNMKYATHLPNKSQVVSLNKPLWPILLQQGANDTSGYNTHRK